MDDLRGQARGVAQVIEIYIIGGLLLFCGGVVWMLVKVSGERAVARERAKNAVEDANAAKKAGAIVAENRSDDDTAGRLQSGKF
jgi:hypothetical protein